MKISDEMVERYCREVIYCWTAMDDGVQKPQRDLVRRGLETALRAPAPARPTREEIIDLLAKSRGVMPHEYLADAILALWPGLAKPSGLSSV